MYTVMIVDDDVLVRVGLQSLTDWKARGLEIVAESSGGREAVTLLARHRPDIVITDMYMPEFDGIKFISEGRSICPDTVFVVLSCHNDMEYIKQAMKAGAYDYLLKSSVVDSRELDELLSRIVTMLDLRREQHAKQPGEETPLLGSVSGKEGKKLLFDYLSSGECSLMRLRSFLVARGLDISNDNLFLSALQIDNFEKVSKLISDEKLLLDKAEQCLRVTCDEYGSSVIFYRRRGVFWVLLNVEAPGTFLTAKDKMLSIAERLRMNIKNNFLHTCSVYVDEGRSLDELPMVYQNISQELRSTYCLNYDSVVDVTSSTASIYDRTADDVELPPSSIEDVIAYIRANYRDSISLDDLAAVSNFSKYHLCRKFKDVTSMSIVNYIIQVRLEKAKELLRSQNSQYVFEIAQEVGFNDTSYFNKLFKKNTGLTPIEFQKKAAAETKGD